MYWVYILYSKRIDRFYKGITSNKERRLGYHNKGWNSSTKKGIPWRLIWAIEKVNKKDAAVLEKKLKNLTRIKLVKLMLKYEEGIQEHDILIWLQSFSKF